MPSGHPRPDRRVSARLSIIVAVAENGVIGRGGGLPWRLPDDLRRFKELTMGKPVIMGRRTWESLGRALPGRRNLVVSRMPGYSARGAEIAFSLPDALRRTTNEPEVFVMGGAQLYAEALPLADRLYLTRVHAAVDGDVLFPEWRPEEWVEIQSIPHPTDARHPFSFTFHVYEFRRNPLAAGRTAE